MSVQIHIIGLGVSQPAELSKPALAAMAQADIVLGSERQLALIDVPIEQQCLLPKLSELIGIISPYKWVVVLASGDPLYYGIGQWFCRHYDTDTLHFYPALSSVQAICHELQLSQQDVEVISLHGRPLKKIRSHLQANRYFVILTDKNSSPQALAKECVAAGFEKSKIWVGEGLGSEKQRIQQFNSANLQQSSMSFDPLHVTVIQSIGTGGLLPEFPGIADHHFSTDGTLGKGLLTKKEIRLNILSLLQPTANDIAWDIGAGCGGVAVEWARWNKHGQVYAVEHHEKRLICLRQNRDNFGVVENLTVIDACAPEALAELPRPNKIFIGGSGGELDAILRQSWLSLVGGGVLVVSSITEETNQVLMQFASAHAEITMESVRISVSRQDELAGQTVYRPQLPVTLFKIIKVM